MPAKSAAPSDTSTNTPGAMVAGLSISAEYGLPWFHRFGPLVAFMLLVAFQVAQETGVIPTLHALEQVENVLLLLAGGWVGRLGATLPKKQA